MFYQNVVDLVGCRVEISYDYCSLAASSKKKNINIYEAKSIWQTWGNNHNWRYVFIVFVYQTVINTIYYIFQYVFDIIQDEDTILISLEQHDIQPGRQHFGRRYFLAHKYKIFELRLFCSPWTGFELTPLLYCSTNHLTLCPAP
jgi:hypothetical protein